MKGDDTLMRECLSTSNPILKPEIATAFGLAMTS